VPARAPLVRLEQLDDDLLLYHPGLTRAIHLNQTASIIWQLCDGRRSSQDIAELLCEAFPADREQIPEHVDATLQRFADEGALELL
jgi:hypothetical protein